MDEKRNTEQAPPAPLWVKLLGLAVLLVVVVFIALHLLGGGLGPGIHAPVQHAP